MFLPDYHMHSLCSPDGSAPLTAMAQAAVDAGLTHICLTDHCDLMDGGGKKDRSFDWAPIEAQIAQARPRFDGGLDIRMGLELGEAWEDPAYAQALVERPGVDFVIGSVHNMSAAAGGLDYYFQNYDSDEVCYRCLDDYFTCMEALAGLDCYDVLAHIIYPLRYMNERDGNHASLDRYEERLRGIFRTVVGKGKGIELNTCRGKNVEDWRWVLSLYRDCGGAVLTLGSDAHVPEDVGKGVARAAELARELGFPQVCIFDNRTPKFIEL